VRLDTYLTTRSGTQVTVELGREVDLALVKEIQPDAIVLATGSTASKAVIPALTASVLTSAIWGK